MDDPVIEVTAAAIVCAGRVLTARRTHPADVAGGWELPGGKTDPGETAVDSVVREVREELGCEVAVIRPLIGRTPIKPGYELTAYLAKLVAGEPVPHEHDAIRWLSAEELDEVDWLPSDRPFLGELRALLLQGEKLTGGNVGGAVRVGRTVRRATGAWTPAVHALLAHLATAGLDGVPQVVGIDALEREVLTFLPGRVLDVDNELASESLLADATSWLRRFHQAVAGFEHPGPWRTTPASPQPGQIICHHDFAPYNTAIAANWSQSIERVSGVFDWDLSGPGYPIDDLGFAAWNWIPLHRALAPELAARRLVVLAHGYGGAVAAEEILDHVVTRIQRSIRVISAGQRDGDPGILNLAAVGEPARTAARLDALKDRIPAIRAALSSLARGR